MESIGRASYGIKWAQDLLKQAQERKLDVARQVEDVRLLQQLFLEAKVGWHAFTLDGPQLKAEKAFEESLRIRDELIRKMGPSGSR